MSTSLKKLKRISSQTFPRIHFEHSLSEHTSLSQKIGKKPTFYAVWEFDKSTLNYILDMLEHPQKGVCIWPVKQEMNMRNHPIHRYLRHDLDKNR